MFSYRIFPVLSIVRVRAFWGRHVEIW